MMSAGAFNALLKTLEEPPEHVIFILATTEPFKVLPTIVSRCQRYDFAKIDAKDIREKLVWILNREGVPFDEPALEAIIELADGGMRDALSILDQALAYGGNQLKEKDVLDVFGLTSSAQKCRLLNLVSEGDVSPVLSLAEEFVTSGIDIKRLIQALLDILKDCLVYIKTGNEGLLQSINAKEVNALIGRINAEQANAMIDILIKCQADSKTVGNLRSLFELTLIRMTSLFGQGKPDAVAPKPMEFKPVEPKPVPQPEPIVAPAPKPEPIQQVIPEQPKEEPLPLKAEEPKPAPAPIEEQAVYKGSTAPDWLLEEEPAPVAVKKPKEEAKEEPKGPIMEPKEEPKKPAGPIFPEEKKEEKPAKVEPKNALATEGTALSLDDEVILDIMVLGPKYKPQRQALFERWDELVALRFDPKFGPAATLLAEGRPFCLCAEALLINFNFTRQRDKANLAENQEALSELVATVLGRKVFIYGLDRNDSNRCQNNYYAKKQIGQLPDPSTITLNLPNRR